MSETAPMPSAPAQSDEPFGRPVAVAPEGLLWAKWRALNERIAGDLEALAGWRAEPSQAPPAASRFLAIVERGLAQDGLGRIDVVNRGVNMVLRYANDLDHRGMSDQWDGPLDTFAAGCGDCEDFAAAKYLALRLAGMADDDVRLVLAFDSAIAGHHMVAAARDAGRWVILDNRNMLLLEDRQLANFNPLFVFRSGAVMQYGPAAAPVTFSLAERLARRGAG
jgi:predicted transglutaminase-like cysteine proteinase